MNSLIRRVVGMGNLWFELHDYMGECYGLEYLLER